jgi:hypothetical protein
VWKDNCSNMSAVSYGLVKCELCLYWIYIYIYILCVDHVWLTGHLWNSEYTVCTGWVSECGPCVAHWSSVEQWVYRLCRVSEWVWTMCDSLVICRKVSIPSVQGEWVSVDHVWHTGHLWNSECTVCTGRVSECGPCMAHWSSVEKWVYRLCRVSEWVWTICGSLAICGTVSIPSVQGEWVSECGPCVAHWPSVEQWVYRLCRVSEWVWTMCGSLAICGTVSIPSVQGEWVWTMCGSLAICGSVSIPSVQGEWVSECGPCVAHWPSVDQWVYRLYRLSDRCVHLQFKLWRQQVYPKCRWLKHFVCDSFNNAVSISGCVASDVRMISESWIGKDMKGNVLGLLWGTVPKFPGGPGEKNKDKFLDSHCTCQISNPLPFNTNQTRHSLSSLVQLMSITIY